MYGVIFMAVVALVVLVSVCLGVRNVLFWLVVRTMDRERIALIKS